MLIPLSGKRGRDKFAIIDDIDSWVLNFKWHINSAGYAVRSQIIKNKPTFILLHRFILGLQFRDKRQGDHIDCNKLNNSRKNLRIVTYAQNRQNVKFGRKRPIHNNCFIRGVSWHKQSGKWQAQAGLNKKNHHLGLFDDPFKAGLMAKKWRQENMTHSVED